MTDYYLYRVEILTRSWWGRSRWIEFRGALPRAKAIAYVESLEHCGVKARVVTDWED